MANRHIRLDLTPTEAHGLYMCVRGEIENEDGLHGDYFRILQRVSKKIEQAHPGMVGPKDAATTLEP